MAISPLRKKYLGEVLLSLGKITRDQLRLALAEQKETKERIGAIFLKHDYITEADMYAALSSSLGIPFVKLSEMKAEEEALRLVPEKLARKFKLLPLAKTDDVLKVAMVDPSNISALDELKRETNLKPSIVLASEKEMDEYLGKCYGSGALNSMDFAEGAVDEIADTSENLSPDETEAATSAPVVKYVNSLFYDAITKGASDIHIEPGENNAVYLRIRLDGRLHDLPPPPKKFYWAIVSRIKIISGIDIAERRLPQDGKCKLKIEDKKLDVRVSTLPTIYGEKVVMRLLDRTNVSLRMEDTGFTVEDGQKFSESLNKPYGMILVTGPTGSGKTTTLYTGLNYINKPDVNIVTVEDPVEYELAKINQVQVKSSIGLTFANILRSVLRQDPDIIMVGEIRDKETAEIAVQASLTGHLVLSTLHTNDAVSALNRLKYMGIEPFLIADAVDMIIAQRLVRKICPHCKAVHEVSDSMYEKLHLSKKENNIFYHGTGCEKCYGTGYRGRSAIIEILSMTPAIQQMLMAEAGDIEIKEQAL
ncbi:MAG: ATPase, T2SS/T4P/T4SS family, partial [Endomicrobiales bacterium]